MTNHLHGPDDLAETKPREPDDVRSARTVTGVDVRKLPAQTEIAVDTSNSHYRLVMLEDSGSRALVRGGCHLRDQAEARIEGSTLGSTVLWLGWIGVGLPMELSVQGRRLNTSRVRSITICTASE